MELLARANELASLGHDVIHLEVGEPDFDTPAPIRAAGVRAISEGKTRYTDARGTPELRQAISGFYKFSLGVEVKAERIFVTAGSSGGLLMLSALLLDPGENLLMSDPGYPCNRHFLSQLEYLLLPLPCYDQKTRPRLANRMRARKRLLIRRKMLSMIFSGSWLGSLSFCWKLKCYR